MRRSIPDHAATDGYFNEVDFLMDVMGGYRDKGQSAKVAMARKLAVCLYWMWRKGWNYEQLTKFSSHAGQLGNRHGVQSNTE